MYTKLVDNYKNIFIRLAVSFTDSVKNYLSTIASAPALTTMVKNILYFIFKISIIQLASKN